MAAITRFGIVGLDHWYAAMPLAQQLAARSDTELVAISDSDVSRASELAQTTGMPRVSEDALSVIEDPSIDVIASFASVDQNPGNCIEAARNGKHIIAIKPLALTLQRASEVVLAVQDAGVVFLPSESRGRDSKVGKLLRSWVDTDRVGTILSASFTVSADLPQAWPGNDSPGWWADTSRSPGGGWVDHSIYDIDLLRWLLRDEVASVKGDVANLLHDNIPFEDFGHAVIRFEGGAIATIEDSWNSPGGWRSTSTITGTKASVNVDTLTGKISILEGNNAVGGWAHLAMPGGAQKSVQIDAMLSAIRRPQSASASVHDAWKNLAVCLAFYESSASGLVVTPERLAV
ncbi:Gfo/Idh/MocA family oxidoreductase [Rhodoglobus aureus]|uniref:Gfo/Idh/MocA family oxidoreductase n=1 Tax=Rhodoglobus aureus TaxID=191497 RepID=A0ABP4GBM0_9MICO